MAGVGGTGSSFSSVLGKLGGSLYAYVRSRFTSQKFLTYMANINVNDLRLISDLAAVGKVAPVVDRTFPLSETPAAMRYLETGHARGKVVVAIAAKS
jgi:NADPH:quinone reductase-like Zn-dependent oxidoreductase